MIENAIAKTLQKLREHRQISQEDLALHANLHRTYVSQLERGLKTPTLKTIHKLCLALNISMVEFIKLIEDEIKS
jgi:transcriptional regulator with XRE-family HTH domain